MWACGSAGRRVARTIAPRSGRAAPFYACGSAACIVAAIAVAEASRPPDSLQIAVLGVLLGVSTVVGMAIMSTPVPPGPRTGGADARRRGGHGTPSEGGGGGWPGTDRAFSAALGTVAAVIAIVAIAAIAAGAPAPDSGATWNEWLTHASAACHDTASGCGRAALTGGGVPHILLPPPVITGAGVPATVSISGLLGDDAGPPTRITVSVSGPVGVRGAQSAPAPPHSYNHTVMTTQDGRWSIHHKIDAGMRPGTYDYAVSTTYTERPSGFAVHVDAGTFAVTVLEPRPSHSSPPPLPPLFPGGNGDGDGGDGGGDTDADNGNGTAGGPVHVIDGIVRFNAVQGPASAGQVVAISFAYGDGLPRESSVLVRGPLPDGPVRLGPAHVLAAQRADGAKFAHEFIVQPTWPAGTYEAVVRHGGGAGGGGGGGGTRAGALQFDIAERPGGRICMAPLEDIGLDARTGRCYAGIVTGTAGPDTILVDGRPAALTLSNARHGGDAAAAAAAEAYLAGLCAAGTAAIVDRDDTLAADTREPYPAVSSGYHTAWCMGASGAAYGGGDSVNRAMVDGGHASADPVGCLTAERRHTWPECSAYTAAERAVGAAVDAVSGAAMAVTGGDNGDGDSAGGGGGDCAIAAIAYGTPMAVAVQALREHRDAFASAHPLSAAALNLVLHAYYAVSPPIADAVRGDPYAKAAAAAALAAPVSLAAAAAAGAAAAGAAAAPWK